jgi:hypothetical protein
MGFSRRAVLAFDIAGSIPPGAVIDSATLTLNFSRTTSSTQTISMHRVLTDWGEGVSDAAGEEGSGELSSINDATWTHTFFNTLFWTAAGGDYSPTVSASRTVGSDATYGHHTWGSTSQMTADVQDWLDNPSGNFGWILIGNEAVNRTSKRFDSRENAVAGNRPALTVYYRSIPCEDLTNMLARCTNSGTLQARVVLRNNVIHAGKLVTIMIDSTSYVLPIVTNGVSSRAQVVLPGSPGGDHTVSLVDPADCFDPIVVSCPSTLASSDAIWEADDALWAQASGNNRTMPTETRLIGNYPNPFNPSTTIRYVLSEDLHVTLKVYNVIGQEIATLIDHLQPAGEWSVVWDGASEAAAGVYLVSLKAGNVHNVQKMIVVK